MDTSHRKSDGDYMANRQPTDVPNPNPPEISLDAILSFLKDTRGTVNWSAKDLRNCLKLDAKQAQQVLTLLALQGYIEKKGDDWLTTAAGETVSKSKKPQFSPHSVTKAVRTLRERIEAVNRDKRSEFKIRRRLRSETSYPDALRCRLLMLASSYHDETRATLRNWTRSANNS